MKTFGYIVANPAEFLIHQRFGKIRHQGRGISVFCLPVIDRYYRIPSSTHGLTFAADQITAENQGVEVSGFAIWKISDPEKTSQNFDFTDVNQAVQTIAVNLKDVVESAIRHQVAKMTIEDVLRKRGSIILELKQELAYIAEQWGLTIETIEIKNVRIMSAQLFANMQARFRDEVRLTSETSGLETEREIAERRAAQREQLAVTEQEFKRKESERKAELDAMNTRAAAELAALKQSQEKEQRLRELAHEAELAEARHANKEKALRLEEKLNEVERDAQEKRFALETDRSKHTAALAAAADETDRRKIETANLADARLAFIKELPAALGSLAVQELNLGDNMLARLADAARDVLGKDGREA